MQNNFKDAMKVSIISIIGNVFLSIFKFTAGFLGKSNALISDGIHSLTDLLSTMVVMVGLKLSNKKEDKCHPYGHERIECVAALILSIVLFITGIGIGIVGLKTIFFKNYTDIEIPTVIALIAAFVSIIIKEGMFWYTRSIAKRINSNALMADAWHNRSDALASFGSLIGIVGAMLGFKLLDPIASIAICFCIIKVAVNIFNDSISKMIDKSCSSDFIKELSVFVLGINGVLEINSIKTRLFGSKICVDLIIETNTNLTLIEANQISISVYSSIKQNFEKVKHCTINVIPKV